jgi:hypothetical protein
MSEFGTLRRTDWLLFVGAVAVAFSAYVWRQGVPSLVDALVVGVVLGMGGVLLRVGTRLADRRT